MASNYPSNDFGSPTASFACSSIEQKGATVEGSKSNQQFNLVSAGNLLYGETTNQFQLLAPKSERQPVTVKDTKFKYCTVCGTKLPKYAKYCMSCGLSQTSIYQ